METSSECSTWWSKLPEHLKMDVLARLPTDSLCRYGGGVCREWNALFSPWKFKTNEWVVAPPNNKPWLVIWYQYSTGLWCEAYCFSTKRWKSLSFVQKGSQLHRTASLNRSAAGLFLVTIQVDRARLLPIISNPLTGNSLVLPILSSKTVVGLAMGMTPGDGNSTGDTYKVIIVVQLRTAQTVEIYDSSLKSWRTAGHLPKNWKATRTPLGKSMVICKDFLYCMAKDQLNSQKLGVLRFNIITATSIFVPLPHLAAFPTFWHSEDYLLTCGSRILIATLKTNVAMGIVFHIAIWEFDDDGLDSNGFKGIALLPLNLLDDFEMKYYIPSRPFDFEGVGDLVCMTHQDWNKVIIYNLSSGTWCCVPRDDDLAGREPFISISAFEPRPDMKVD